MDKKLNCQKVRLIGPLLVVFSIFLLFLSSFTIATAGKIYSAPGMPPPQEKTEEPRETERTRIPPPVEGQPPRETPPPPKPTEPPPAEPSPYTQPPPTEPQPPTQTEEIQPLSQTEPAETPTPTTIQPAIAPSETPTPDGEVRPTVTASEAAPEATTTSEIYIEVTPTRSPTTVASRTPGGISLKTLFQIGPGGIAILGSLALGAVLLAGAGLLVNKRRKKKLLPLAAKECEKIRADNKRLLKALKGNQKQLNEASRQERRAWEKYRGLLHQSISPPEANKAKRRTREDARQAFKAAAKQHREIYRQRREILEKLRGLFDKHSECKDCCELERLVNDLKKEVIGLEKDCGRAKQEHQDAGQRAQREQQAAHTAERGAAQAREVADPQKAYQEAQQRLRDFIERGSLMDSRITTDPKIGKGWDSWVEEDLGAGVKAYAQGYTAYKVLRDYLKDHKAKYEQLKTEVERARQRIEQREQGIEELESEKGKRQQAAQDARLEQEAAGERRDDCVKLLKDLKELLREFEPLMVNCFQELEKCRKQIRDKNETLRKSIKELEECKSKLKAQIKHLNVQRGSLKKYLKRFPTLRKKHKEIDQALKKAKECLEGAEKLRPKFQTPARGKCGRLEDCKAKLQVLSNDLDSVRNALDKCNQCRNRAIAVVQAFIKAVAKGLGPDIRLGKPGDVCCKSGQWYGYGWTWGARFFFGYQSSYMVFVCAGESSNKYVVLASRTWSWGAAAGFETGALFGFVWGSDHPHETVKIWKKSALSGMDFDLSLGLSITNFLKKSQAYTRLLRLSKVKNKPAKIVLKAVDKVFGTLRKEIKLTKSVDRMPRVLKDVFATGAARTSGSLLKASRKAAVKGAKGAAKDALVGGQGALAIPLTGALQAGIWINYGSRVHVNEYQCCTCNQTMAKHVKDSGEFRAPKVTTD